MCLSSFSRMRWKNLEKLFELVWKQFISKWRTVYRWKCTIWSSEKVSTSSDDCDRRWYICWQWATTWQQQFCAKWRPKMKLNLEELMRIVQLNEAKCQMKILIIFQWLRYLAQRQHVKKLRSESLHSLAHFVYVYLIQKLKQTRKKRLKLNEREETTEQRIATKGKR